MDGTRGRSGCNIIQVVKSIVVTSSRIKITNLETTKEIP